MLDHLNTFHLREVSPEESGALLRINGECQPGVALLDETELARLSSLGGQMFVAAGSNTICAYLIVFQSQAPYDGEEFRVFQRAQREPFLYVDQLAVGGAYRRRGIAKRMYGALADGSMGLPTLPICCEVNLHPPNPGSLSFHTRMGFSVIQNLKVSDGRVVALMARPAGVFEA